MTKQRLLRRIVPMMYLAAVTGGLVVATTGCTSSSQPTTRPANWTDQAKADPFNYNPSATEDWPSVSGGGISHFDKNAFKRDMDNVLNP
jgi:hypothetical protein